MLSHNGYNVDVHSFADLDENTVLIEDHELHITALHAYAYVLDYLSFVYFETEALVPIETSSEMIEKYHPEYVEVHYYDGKVISTGEYNAGVLDNDDGKTVLMDSDKLSVRIRPLVKKNWLLVSPLHPVNSAGYDQKTDGLLDGILSGKHTIEELDNYMTSFPRPDFYRN